MREEVSRGEEAPAHEDPEKNENIVLDVRVTEMIDNVAFRAVLENGHAMVAYLPFSHRGVPGGSFNVGDRARVRMSPFDMSRGELICCRNMEHEG
jgi:translation initiation factor IF-1